MKTIIQTALTSKEIIRRTEELEALAQLAIDHGNSLKRFCSRLRRKAAGVSTPAFQKGLSKKEQMSVVIQRERRMAKPKT
ncbi:MAG TPA: hypothetical protein VKR32_17100 [Puia sp.]|nr:hypothetical protein [Puia sp.]